ncbi:MAG: hypothetical protein RIT40_2368 [Planctomycetota bacterium]|jgi:hypothetical protein
MFSNSYLTLSSIVLGAGLSLATIAQVTQGPAAQHATAILQTSGEPLWYGTYDIGNGVELELWVGSTATVVDPSTNTNVRAVSMHMNFLYGVGVMQQIDSLKLYPLTGTSTETFHMAGIDRNVVAPQRPAHAVLGYSISVTPKSGYTWGTIRGPVDLDVVATQL